jgi:outer membrane lipase/esterase
VAIATQVNRLADAGARVLITTVPDVSLTPYGRSKTVAGTARLSYLTARVNAKLLVTIDNDGRRIGLIELNPYLIAVVSNPPAYGYRNARDAACVPVDPLQCTTATLRENEDGSSASSTTWLWASELQLSPGGHAQLGSLAQSRARNQPF